MCMCVRTCACHCLHLSVIHHACMSARPGGTHMRTQPRGLTSVRSPGSTECVGSYLLSSQPGRAKVSVGLWSVLETFRLSGERTLGRSLSKKGYAFSWYFSFQLPSPHRTATEVDRPTHGTGEELSPQGAAVGGSSWTPTILSPTPSLPHLTGPLSGEPAPGGAWVNEVCGRRLPPAV